MALEYSPHRSAGGTMHLLSPSHSPLSVDTFPSIRQIRRSLSRSPSKAPRFQLHTATRSSPRHLAPTIEVAQSQCTDQATESAPRFSVKRANPTRAAGRRQSLQQGATRPSDIRPTPSSRLAASVPDEEQENAQEEDKTTASNMLFELDSEPIKFELLKAHAEKHNMLTDSVKEQSCLVKSSPLKRSDGLMNLETPQFGSPRAKRRSLAVDPDFDVFDQDQTSPSDGTTRRRSSVNNDSSVIMQGAIQPPKSPQTRPFSFRRSTLQQRVSKPTSESSDTTSIPSPSLTVTSPIVSRTRSRISLESVLPVRNLEISPQVPQRKPSNGATKPHPLSKALSPSSSASSIGEDAMPAVAPAPQPRAPLRTMASFSKSLPIGALRPALAGRNGKCDDTFETPEGFKSARPLPAAFMSTGLISKRNRDVDLQPGAFGKSLNMPDTPSKKTADIIEAATPSHRPHLGKLSQPRHEFGSPTTPFSPQAFRTSAKSFGKGVSIFGSKVIQGRLVRRSSFLSIEGEDASTSPVSKPDVPMSGVEELPPTPTKATHVPTRPVVKGKGNSLRSSLLGRRTSMAPDLFVAPEKPAPNVVSSSASEVNAPPALTPQNTGPDVSATPCITFTPSGGQPSPSLGRSRGHRLPVRDRSPSPLSQRIPLSLSVSTQMPNTAGKSSSELQTPQDTVFPRNGMTLDAFTPPDASRLTISGSHHGQSLPPATPTGPRDLPFGMSTSLAVSASGFFEHDVDTVLTSRFGSVHVSGVGEFSIVYRVTDPLPDAPSARFRSPRSMGKVWAVKKTKKPYTGAKDRAQKMKEVQLLETLRNSEHVIETVDTWEHKNHLYIQTEFCENGNLKDFLTRAGYKARLDDFRIWKILLEMSQGLKCIHDAGIIHLDIKPANILIDWEGSLKIADFGLATTWPAPRHIDGEGDREYIAPECLSGVFDKPADIFSMGMVVLEIAGNIVLPDNGSSWQRLRAGDMSDLPSLTFSSDSSLERDESGDPVEMLSRNDNNDDSIVLDDSDLGFDTPKPAESGKIRPQDRTQPPAFMVEASNEAALDKLVQRLISPNPSDRPDVDQVLASDGLEWVAQRRRAGATVYEGNWGPAGEVLGYMGDVDMVDI